MRRLGPAVLAVVAVGLYLAVAVPSALVDAGMRLRVAVETAGLPLRDMRPSSFGPEYAAAIERLRALIPRDEPYVIDESDPEGSIFWVRYDLLPRRTLAGRTRSALSLPGRDCWEAQMRWHVIGMGLRRAPVVMLREPHLPPGCAPAPWWKQERRGAVEAAPAARAGSPS